MHIIYKYTTMVNEIITEAKEAKERITKDFLGGGRRLGSKPDIRVPFEPDAWEWDVLDCVDADESVLVIVATSAGKTYHLGLLLLAPCLIIALSATVGDTRELRDWLAMS
ncbi:hypothetical protein BKA59DRAFT_448442 [Fusarium tricinctum]|uniref:DEAD/DEAH box helicase domain-containing protein n=1 Tax=Fusarium tricinctum TaxID=61284 RepID=A0A8K0WID9_9HYPO|nr:hypothetical protein BKA59DRAFT_448442 [Fusarium tricinctum]